MSDKDRMNRQSPYVRYKSMADDDIAILILGMIEKSPEISQRKITLQTGLAAGLVHSFMRRVINKGWVRAKQVSAKRWLYFVTPEGFMEKSRLTIDYVSRTLSNYRSAQNLIQEQLSYCLENNFRRLVVAGENEIAEIAALNIKANKDLMLVAIVTNGSGGDFVDQNDILPFGAVSELDYDRILVCDINFLKWRRKQEKPVEESSIMFFINREKRGDE